MSSSNAAPVEFDILNGVLVGSAPPSLNKVRETVVALTSNDVSAVQQALAEIDVWSGDKNIQQLLLEAHFFSAVVTCLRQHSTHSAIVGEVCMIVSFMSLMGYQRMSALIGQQGAVQEIAKAILQCDRQEHNINYYACTCLWLLLRDSPEIRSSMAPVVIPALNAMVDERPTHRHTQEHARNALQLLSTETT